MGLRRSGELYRKPSPRRGPRGIGFLLLPLLALAIVPPVLGAEAVPSVSAEAFGAQIATAQRLLAACARMSSACDPADLPQQETVRGVGKAEFRVSWQWLRDALNTAKGASAADRAKAMEQAEDHLSEWATDLSGSAPAAETTSFARTRAAADSVLASGEFQAAEGPTWFDRQVARVQDWVVRLFTGMGRVGERNPWLAPLIEWTCFGLAAGGLLYFVRRSLARQALRLTLGEGAAPAQRDGRGTTDWTQQAEEQAAAQHWREAVHCLYWAAILSLETRRAWRPNPTRTPREYVSLLRPGSEAQRALRALTGTLERVWYGFRTATETDFREAEANFRAIVAADLRQSGARLGARSGAEEQRLRPAGAG